jgi:hypothetical protein
MWILANVSEIVLLRTAFSSIMYIGASVSFPI